MSEHQPLIPYLWGLLTLPLLWLWQRIGKAENATDELRKRVAADEVTAAHFLSRAEVQEVVDRSLKPVLEDLAELKTGLKDIITELNRHWESRG